MKIGDIVCLKSHPSVKMTLVDMFHCSDKYEDTLPPKVEVVWLDQDYGLQQHILPLCAVELYAKL